MQLEMQQLFKLLFWALLASACSTSKKDLRSQGGYPNPPYQKVFKADYNKVWKAMQLVLLHYPIRISNRDSGVLETDFIKIDKGWSSPTELSPKPGGGNYIIRARAVRGTSMTYQPTSTVRVKIEKIVKARKDFFSKAKKIETDGLEELSLLYRISRELKIERALDRLHTKETN